MTVKKHGGGPAKSSSRKPKGVQASGRRKGRKPPSRDKSGAKNAPSSLWLYGRHAVAAALANPVRETLRVLATQNAIEWLAANASPKAMATPITDARPEEIDQLLPSGAVHQGLAAEVRDLPRLRLKDVCANPVSTAPILVLDQVTDPQNIGAIFRTAAAFNARAVIVQDRPTPPLAGALAKAAAGAVEITPCIHVVNIARALEALSALGYETAGLAGEATAPLQSLDPKTPTALVLGAEGAGLRRLVAQTCTRLVRIPISPKMESLNVSAACAVALYAVSAQD